MYHDKTSVNSNFVLLNNHALQVRTILSEIEEPAVEITHEEPAVEITHEEPAVENTNHAEPAVEITNIEPAVEIKGDISACC